VQPVLATELWSSKWPSYDVGILYSSVAVDFKQVFLQICLIQVVSAGQRRRCAAVGVGELIVGCLLPQYEYLPRIDIYLVLEAGIRVFNDPCMASWHQITCRWHVRWQTPLRPPTPTPTRTVVSRHRLTHRLLWGSVCRRGAKASNHQRDMGVFMAGEWRKHVSKVILGYSRCLS
jgi:hypothetical protein